MTKKLLDTDSRKDYDLPMTTTDQPTVTLHIITTVVYKDDVAIGDAVVAYCFTLGEHYGIHYIDHYNGTDEDLAIVTGFLHERIEGSGYPYIVAEDD